MNYYQSLYDINFFSCESYRAIVGKSSLVIRNPGIPDWDTWQSPDLNKQKAADLCQNFREIDEDYSKALLFNADISEHDRLLILLVLCEDAYRSFDSKTFQYIIRILYSSNDKELQLKALKLTCARFALFCLANGNRKPLDFIKNHCIDYLNSKRKRGKIYTFSDIRVEIPVRSDWSEMGVSVEDEKGVLEFYKNTYSYILELTAANHQVETLFNYYIIIELLKRLGVDTIYDYGGGIGTFALLASRLGIRGVCADLESHTLDYAVQKFKDFDAEIVCAKVDSAGEITPYGLDCIICTEVVEHVFNPDYLVRHFYNCLRSTGIFVVSESFDYIEDFCGHLPQHKGKGGEHFIDFLKNIGFTPLNIRHRIHPTIYIKN